MEKGLVFGGKCTELLVIYDPESLSWRMWLPLFQMVSAQYQNRWPNSGMTLSGRLYQLDNSERHTSVKDGLVLPTPTATDYGSNNTTRPNSKRKRHSLQSMGRLNLLDSVVLPTPTVNEARNNPTGSSQWRREHSLNVEEAKLDGYTQKTIGIKTRLNPHFVNWMMGFPIGWLD